ncbi:CCA tRNA nucleotidyltransferase, partial [Staphylococcus succinus]
HNDIVTISPLIINTITINEVTQQLPIISRKELNINGKDLIQTMNVPSGAWVKIALRQIECAVVAGDVKNIKEDLIEWVKRHVKI